MGVNVSQTESFLHFFSFRDSRSSHQQQPISNRSNAIYSSTQTLGNNHRYNSGFDSLTQTLIHLTTSNKHEVELIQKNIETYERLNKQNKIPSICNLKEHFHLFKKGYCTNQQQFYLIFSGGISTSTLKDEYNLRRILRSQNEQSKFTYQQIIKILKVMLIGVRVYDHQFQRKIQKIDLDDIYLQFIDKKNSILSKMYLADPWLKQKRENQSISVNQVNVLLQNPSPQRLRQFSMLINDDHSGYNEFNSILFSIGVIGLKLLQMNFVDDIYIKSPHKAVNLQRIKKYLQDHYHSSSTPSYQLYPPQTKIQQQIKFLLLQGLQILLLSSYPYDRQRIYKLWGINNSQHETYLIKAKGDKKNENEVKVHYGSKSQQSGERHQSNNSTYSPNRSLGYDYSGTYSQPSYNHFENAPSQHSQFNQINPLMTNYNYQGQSNGHYQYIGYQNINKTDMNYPIQNHQFGYLPYTYKSFQNKF